MVVGHWSKIKKSVDIIPLLGVYYLHQDKWRFFMKKININMPFDLLKKLDEYAEKNYITRTAAICMIISQFLSMEEK